MDTSFNIYYSYLFTESSNSLAVPPGAHLKACTSPPFSFQEGQSEGKKNFLKF